MWASACEMRGYLKDSSPPPPSSRWHIFFLPFTCSSVFCCQMQCPNRTQKRCHKVTNHCDFNFQGGVFFFLLGLLLLHFSERHLRCCFKNIKTPLHLSVVLLRFDIVITRIWFISQGCKSFFFSTLVFNTSVVMERQARALRICTLMKMSLILSSTDNWKKTPSNVFSKYRTDWHTISLKLQDICVEMYNSQFFSQSLLALDSKQFKADLIKVLFSSFQILEQIRIGKRRNRGGGEINTVPLPFPMAD